MDNERKTNKRKDKELTNKRVFQFQASAPKIVLQEALFLFERAGLNSTPDQARNGFQRA